MDTHETNCGYIFDMQRYSIHNGPGIRITLFLQGCPLRCWWCHNPEGIRHIPGESMGDSSSSPSMRKLTVLEAVKEIEKEILFFDESGGGVTFSGGEPLIQHEFLKAMLKECRKREIHTAIDTSGYASPEIVKSIMDIVDLFLYDLKLIDAEKHEEYTGVSNQLILENLRLISNARKPVLLRFPLIPGITDTEENLLQMAEYLKTLSMRYMIYILPFHKTAQRKYLQLQIEDKVKSIAPPTAERVNYVKTYFEQNGFLVHVGG